jgi:hypothetical protein
MMATARGKGDGRDAMARKKIRTTGRPAQRIYGTFITDLVRGRIRATELIDTTEVQATVQIPVQTVDQLGNPLTTTVAHQIQRVTAAEFEDPG